MHKYRELTNLNLGADNSNIFTDLTNRLHNMGRNVQREANKENWDSLKSNEALVTSNTNLENKVIELQKNIEKLTDENTAIKMQQKQMYTKEEYEVIQGKLQRLTAQKQSISKDRDAYKKEISSLRKELADKEKEFDKWKNQYQEEYNHWVPANVRRSGSAGVTPTKSKQRLNKAQATQQIAKVFSVTHGMFCFVCYFCMFCFVCYFCMFFFVNCVCSDWNHTLCDYKTNTLCVYTGNTLCAFIQKQLKK